MTGIVRIKENIQGLWRAFLVWIAETFLTDYDPDLEWQIEFLKVRSREMAQKIYGRMRSISGDIERGGHEIGARFTRVPIQVCRDSQFQEGILFDPETAERIYRYRDYRGLVKRLSGRRCFVIGGGSSLQGFDFSRIEGEYTIGCNAAGIRLNTDVLVFVEQEFLNLYRDQINAFQGEFICCAARTAYLSSCPDTLYFQGNDRVDPSMDPYAGWYSGWFAGISAVHIALMMDAAEIYLLGFDLDPAAEKQNWYHGDTSVEGYGERACEIKSGMFEAFRPWRDRIFNCNPESRIRTFEFKNIGEVLG